MYIVYEGSRNTQTEKIEMKPAAAKFHETFGNRESALWNKYQFDTKYSAQMYCNMWMGMYSPTDNPETLPINQFINFNSVEEIECFMLILEK